MSHLFSTRNYTSYKK